MNAKRIFNAVVLWLAMWLLVFPLSGCGAIIVDMAGSMLGEAIYEKTAGMPAAVAPTNPGEFERKQ
jgi:hypothetical protein